MRIILGQSINLNDADNWNINVSRCRDAYSGVKQHYGSLNAVLLTPPLFLSLYLSCAYTSLFCLYRFHLYPVLLLKVEDRNVFVCFFWMRERHRERGKEMAANRQIPLVDADLQSLYLWFIAPPLLSANALYIYLRKWGNCIINFGIIH